MSQPTSHPSNPSSVRFGSGAVLAALAWTLVGCQLTDQRRALSPPRPVESPVASSTAGTSSPAPATTATNEHRLIPLTAGPVQPRIAPQWPTQAQAQTPGQFGLGPAAIVRGQSGDGWVAAPPPAGLPGSPPPGSSAESVNRYQTQPQTEPLPLYNPTVTPSTVYPATPNSVAPGYGYAPSPYATQIAPAPAAPSYGAAIAPGVVAGQSAIAPGSLGYTTDPLAGLDIPNITAPGGYQPRVQVAPLDVYVQEARTGRIILGGSVNSDLGVAGQLIIDERNFDIRAIPRSWSDMFSGYAFRGAGQSFRAELMPGNLVERYTVNWATPNMFGYLPYSLSVGGFLFSRIYRDWTEQRLGGRIGLGYAITKDLSIGTELRGENVKITNPRVNGVDALDDVLGDNELYSARFRINRDTRDSVFLATEGTMLELIYDQAFGKFDYPQGQVNFSHYSRVHERPDGQGRHVLVNTWRLGFSGSDTPIFENFFAGGFSTMRGFRFRGASPKDGGVQVGGRFMFLGSLEYMFPLTADEMLRGVAFVDYGTVERDVRFQSDTFRVAPGLGLRIAVPALGPAPLAFDFAVPVAMADGDEKQIFSFYMGLTR